MIERVAFYKRAKSACCIVATCETAVYANILLKKCVVPGTVLSSIFRKIVYKFVNLHEQRSRSPAG